MWLFRIFSRKKKKTHDELVNSMDEKGSKFKKALEQVGDDIRNGVENDEHVKVSSEALKEWKGSVDKAINSLYDEVDAKKGKSDNVGGGQ